MILKRGNWTGSGALNLKDSPDDRVPRWSRCLTNKKSDLLPDCNHERCVDMTVCTLTLMGEWTDLLAVADGGMWVSALFSSLCFLKRRKWRDRSSNASVSLSPEGGAGPGGERTRRQAESTRRGADWPFWSRTSHVMPRWHTEHSDPPVRKLSRKGRQRTLRLHIHLRRNDTHVADGSHWRHWHIRTDLLHRYVVVVISCLALL